MEIKQEEDVSNLQPYVGKHSEVLKDGEKANSDRGTCRRRALMRCQSLPLSCVF